MRRGFTLTELVLAFALVAMAILALVGVFVSGIQLAARSRDVTTATEVGRQMLERVRLNASKGGFAYIPAGGYTFDGRVGQPAVGVAPLQFPPAPYPEITQNNRKFALVVTGQEVMVGRLKSIQVEVWWSDKSKILLETSLHP